MKINLNEIPEWPSIEEFDAILASLPTDQLSDEAAHETAHVMLDAEDGQITPGECLRRMIAIADKDKATTN